MHAKNSKQAFWQLDTEYEDVTIKKVETYTTSNNAAGYEITRDDGWFFLFDPDRHPPVSGHPIPQAGDSIRMFGPGIGRSFRGFAIWRGDDWQIVWYRSPVQDKIHHRIESLERDLRGYRALYDAVAERDEAIMELPDPFRRRLERFQGIGGLDYRANNEPYELFVCQEAVKIASVLPNADTIEYFQKQSWEEQRRTIPALSEDHSGNTFDSACYLARLYIGGREEQIWGVDAGALGPIVGSYKPEADQLRDVIRGAIRALPERHPAHAILTQAFS